MTDNNKWSILQIFAGEGAGAGSAGGTAGEAGGNAAASGDGAADAAQRLRELGVPESKIQKYGKFMRTPRAKAAPADTAEEARQAAAAEAETAQTEEPEKPKYDWDEIMKDPEMNRRMQETVRASKKKAQAAEDAMAALGPALKNLAEEHGLDPENIDYVALAKSMTGEYDTKALELGLPKETVLKMDQQERTIQQQKMDEHIRKVMQQAEAMKNVFPNFDLRTEMQNPVFARLTSPGVNISVEDAYHLIHRQEIEQAKAKVVADKTQQQVMSTIRAGQARPDESGASSQGSTVMYRDWRNASKEQLAEQAKRIREAAAQGRHLRPGE